MKILFPFVGDSVGGSHISALELYSSLVNKNISAIIVLHRDNGPLSEYLYTRNIPFSVLNTSKLAGESPKKLFIIVGIVTNFFCFAKFIKSHKINIVHGNDLRINLTWSLPAKVFSKGFIWHQRTLLSTSIFWLLIRYLCNYFIAISDVVMKNSPNNIQDNKKKVIYNPFNIESFVDKKLARENIVEKYNIPTKCVLLGCVGRIVDYKNIDFLIKNISDIYNNTNKDIYLIIVGTGSKDYVDELKRLACSVGINNNTIFTGFLSNTNKIISSLDVLVAPSLVDAFGRSIVESMLQKTPVLAAKSCGHTNIINDEINGLFYDPIIKGDFIKKLNKILDSKNIEIMTGRAYDFAQTNFSSKQHLNNILSVYQNVSSS